MATLEFNDTLQGVSSNSELQKKLRNLHEQLAELDQDHVDLSSIDRLAQELGQLNLLMHKDKSVKAYLSCCLADVLRLYAPEAPYTKHQIKNIFQFFVRQFKHLGSTNSPNQPEYFYLIESLSSVKSICLVVELEGGDEIMRDIFVQAFDIIGDDSPKNVEIVLADLLMQLLEEATTIPNEVVDILLAQFLPSAVRKRPASHKLAQDVCLGAADKLQRYVCQYFAEQITSTIQGDQGDDDEDDAMRDSDSDSGRASKKRKATGTATNGSSKKTSTGATSNDATPPALITAHNLIRQINRSVPALLTNVIPQLEEELGTENANYRRLATEMLGFMFGEKPGHGDLADKYPSTWRAWLGRSRDKSPLVRMAMVMRLQKIWTQHPELAREIGLTIHKVMLDNDDKIRTTACQLFSDLDFETASLHVAPETLKLLAERCRDRKGTVRDAAFNSLGRLFNLAYSEIESGEDHAIKQFSWIPASMLDSIKFVGEPRMTNSIRYAINTAMLTHILPLPENDNEDVVPWVDRFLLVMSRLNGGQRNTLLSLTHLGLARPSMFDAFIVACEQYNGGIVESNAEALKSRLNITAGAISETSPEPTKTREDLIKFAKANEKQLYRLLKTLLDDQLDVKTLLKNTKEVQRRVQAISSGMSDTFTFFIRSVSYQLINRSSVPTLIKRASAATATAAGTGSGSGSEVTCACALVTLQYVSKHRPQLYKAHVPELTKALNMKASAVFDDESEAEDTASDNDDVDEVTRKGKNTSKANLDRRQKRADRKKLERDRVKDVVKTVLHALSRLLASDKSMTIDKKLSDRAKAFATSDESTHAKYAATILALDSSRPGAADDVVETLTDELSSATDEQLVARLYALSRLAKYARDSFEKRSEDITREALVILTKPSIEQEVCDDDNWATDEEACGLARARGLAVKVLTNRCLPYATSGREAVQTVSEPVFQLLWKLMDSQDGESPYTLSTASRLRMAAALSMLKLAAAPSFESAISQRFELFASIAQDECFEVRYAFVNKLLAYLRSGRIRLPKYNMVLFLVAHDPEEEILAAVKHYIETRARRVTQAARQEQLEYPFVRLMHLLAHHADFQPGEHTEEEVASVSKYLELYLDCLATKDNVPYLFHLALKIKSVRDHDPAYDSNLYLISELAQHLIRQLAKTHNWAISSHPGSVKMPADIFRTLPDKRRAEVVAKTAYLPTELLSKVSFTGANKHHHRDATTTTARNGGGGRGGGAIVPVKRRSPRKHAAAGASSRKTGKRRKSEDWDSDAATESDGEEEDEDEDDGDDDQDDEMDSDDEAGSSNKKVKRAGASTVAAPKGTRSRPARGTAGANSANKGKDGIESGSAQEKENKRVSNGKVKPATATKQTTLKGFTSKTVVKSRRSADHESDDGNLNVRDDGNRDMALEA